MYRVVLFLLHHSNSDRKNHQIGNLENRNKTTILAEKRYDRYHVFLLGAMVPENNAVLLCKS